MKSTRPFLRGLLSIFVAATSTLAAASPAQSDTVDAEAIQLLRRSTDYLAGVNQLRIDTDATIEAVLPSGQKVQSSQRVVITVQRPNKMRAERIGEVINQTFYYDGKTLAVDLPDSRYYAVAPAPPTLERMLDFARDDLDIIAPGSDLIYQDSFKRLTQGLTSAFVVGKSVVNGFRCDHVAFRNAEVDWQIWIEDGTTPLPRKFIVTSKHMSASPQFVVELSTWDAAPKLTDATFNFVPSQGSQEIDFLSFAPVPTVKKADEQP